MITAIWAVGLMVGLALVTGASTVRDAIKDAVDSVAEAIENAAPADHTPRPTRTVAAEPGTRLAYILKGKASIEIGYAPVLAFVESAGTAWQALAIVKGKLYLDDGFIDRVLLPGESVTDEEATEMKQTYIEVYPAEVRFLTEQTKSNV